MADGPDAKTIAEGIRIAKKAEDDENSRQGCVGCLAFTLAFLAGGLASNWGHGSLGWGLIAFIVVMFVAIAIGVVTKQS